MREDEALWIGITRRSTKAFEQVYSDNFARVRSFLRIYLGPRPVVDDVAQETFLQLWQRPGRFDPSRSSLRTYLFGMARNRAADWWRRERPGKEADCASASEEGHGSSVLLNDSLDRLDPELRNVLWLREVEGYSYQELSRILEIPLGTVKSRLFTAREELRRIWNRHA
jgi:RNA polymerase sigma-70 factor (ECF subfamily)